MGNSNLNPKMKYIQILIIALFTVSAVLSVSTEVRLAQIDTDLAEMQKHFAQTESTNVFDNAFAQNSKTKSKGSHTGGDHGLAENSKTKSKGSHTGGDHSLAQKSKTKSKG